jgi:hypothetical protein
MKTIIFSILLCSTLYSQPIKIIKDSLNNFTNTELASTITLVNWSNKVDNDNDLFTRSRTIRIYVSSTTNVLGYFRIWTRPEGGSNNVYYTTSGGTSILQGNYIYELPGIGTSSTGGELPHNYYDLSVFLHLWPSGEILSYLLYSNEGNLDDQEFETTDEDTWKEISGYIRKSDNTPVSSVFIDFSNNGGFTSTNSNGYYSKLIQHGWSGSAVPSFSDGWSFNPSIRNYSNVTSNISNQNFTAIPPIVNITVNPTSINFGNVNIGQISDQTLTITNGPNSTGDLSGSISISGNGFSIVSGGGSYNLSPGGTRNVVVRFSPNQSGSHTGSLSITHNAGNQSSPVPVPLSGNGVATINISVNPTSINFGNVNIGQNSDQTVTITNGLNSTGNLIGEISISGNGFSIVSGGGSYNLSPGGTRNVVVRFSPNQSGSHTGSLSITHNAGNQSSPVPVPLSGNGVATINISVNPTSINFGNVNIGQNSDQTVTITNGLNSTGNLIGEISISGNGFSIVSGGGSYNLSPGGTRNVVVRFSPNQSGSHTGSLSITHNAGNQSSPVPVPLSGNGVETINITVSPISLNFGNVIIGRNKEGSIIITNGPNSTGNLIGNISVGGNGLSLVSGGGNYNLASGQSHSATVRFSPTDSGQNSGTLTITHNAGNQPNPFPVSLSGNGETPTLSINPASIQVAADTGSINFTVNSNETWTLSESCDWVTVSPVADSGNKVITVNYFANTSSSPRQCQIIVGLNHSIMIEVITLNQDGLTSIDKFDYSSSIPAEFYLAQNYPNPFNPTTSFNFGLREESNVTLRIYDITGILVDEIVSNDVLRAGTYGYKFEANNLSSGIYLYSLSAISTSGNNNFIETKKMILLR